MPDSPPRTIGSKTQQRTQRRSAATPSPLAGLDGAKAPAADGREGGGIQAVGRALDVLDLLVQGDHGVTQIGRSLGVNKSTASRLLSTMLTRGFVARNPVTGSFGLGPRIVRLYGSYLDSSRVTREASVLIERVARESGETALLTLFEDGRAIYVDKVDSSYPLRTSSRIGDEAPLHCGAAGKSILAHVPVDDVPQLLGDDGLRKFTHRTITSRVELDRELASIRRKGYAWSDEEINVGVVGVGVALLNARGAPVGAMSLTAPKIRVGPERRRELIAILSNAARAWEERTGAAI